MRVKNNCAPNVLIIAALLFCALVSVPNVLSRSGEDIYANNRYAVVTVVTFDASGNAKGVGSGFFTSSEGEIITNYHVIEGATSLLVKLLNGAMFPVSGLLASAPDKDIAVLKVDGKELSKVNLGSLKSVRVGQTVFALGSSLGMEQTFTSGMVNSLRDGSEVDMPKLPKVIQHQAPISLGNSGGPLFNNQGLVVGINTFIVKGGQNLNFAIPIDYVKPLLGRKAVRPLLGKKTVKTPPVTSLQRIKGKAGMAMVLIPAGEFMMGTNDSEKRPLINRGWWNDDEMPEHTVYLDAFYIDKYEVTNAQYAVFLNDYGKNVDAKGHKLLEIGSSYCLIEKVGSTYQPKAGYENHPVICVSWFGAAAYAQFYGKRLPTEAEWEKAARGGLVGKRFPWGDSNPDGSNANFADKNTNYKWSDKTVDDGYKLTAPVGSFPSNGYGLYDMPGNVWEWCSDRYAGDYYANSPINNPQGPSSGSRRVLRGGTWYGSPDFLRCADRFGGFVSGSGSVGFRCSQDL